VEAVLQGGPHLVSAHAVYAQPVGAHLVQDAGVGVGLDGEVDAEVVPLGQPAYGVERLAEYVDVVVVEGGLRPGEFI
ncbi:hypothetical protein NP234_24800, partial [Salmonella enterica]|nr:hypothetical protein [Salmonella enterica]